MKKTIFSIFTASILLIACNKTDMQQASDTFKNADSLFSQAKDGFKTLDSISKIVNDSSKLREITNNPEIINEAKRIENEIKKGNISIDSIQKTIKKIDTKNINLDSLNKQFEKIKKTVNQSTDVVKAIDSADKAIKNGENAAVVIAETASKILRKNTQKNNQNQAQSQPEIHPSSSQNNKQVIESTPISKTTRMQIAVDDIAAAKAILDQELRNYNGDLITENYTENEGIAKEFITVKVPLNQFNELVNKISSLGSIENKTTEIEGNDYIASQLCDVEITLLDKTPEENMANEDQNVLNKDQNDDTFGAKSSDAFSKGFKGLEDGLIALIPFWPLFLIGGLVWYFVAKNNKKKREEEFQRQLAIEREKMKNTETGKPVSPENLQNITEQHLPQEKKEDDLSKYMPKN